MTYAPETLLEVRRYLQSIEPNLSFDELGIVGGPSHVLAGTSYHLGADQLKFSKNPYSARTRRDKVGLADPSIRNAACAIDIDDDWKDLRAFSVWLVEQCRAGAPDTLDIREIIYSPDGALVYTWDRELGQQSLPQRRGSSSHTTHTHISRYRDATPRPLVPVFHRFHIKPAAPKVVNMFILKVENTFDAFFSNGINTRRIPDGQWEITCVPLIKAGTPFIHYPNLQLLLEAGGPPIEESTSGPAEFTVTVPAHQLKGTIS